MKEGTAIELAQKRMEELGIKNYLLRYRTLQLAPLAKLIIDAENHLYYLIEPSVYAIVRSKAGICNLRDITINEMQFVHRGKITIQNQYETNYLLVKFIQVIPMYNKK